MTTRRCDAVVIGSTLGSVLCATYLARGGLRVTLVEEATLAKTPPLLREPFLLSQLGKGGRIRQMLQEVALPLIEQREFEEDDLALQVLLPDARIDVPATPRALAEELDAHGLIELDAALGWIERVDERAEAARSVLFDEAPPRGALQSRIGLGRRLSSPPRLRAALPETPESLGPYVEAVLTGTSSLEPGRRGPTPSLLLSSARGGRYRMPHAGAPFHELLRRRFLSLHGEVVSADQFQLTTDGGDVGIELERDRVLGRALVVGVAREPLRRMVQDAGAAPRWLSRSAPPARHTARIFRVDRAALPVGLGRRAVVSDGTPEGVYWLERSRDPGSEPVEWLRVGGPGAGRLDPENPFKELAPFLPADQGLIAIEPGTTPVWDVDALELRFVDPDPSPVLRQRPLVVMVGPEATPGLGFEGEALQARAMAARLLQRLALRRIL